MSDAELAAILKLPAEDRLRLVEAIWESLSGQPSDVPLGDVHRAELDLRIAEHEANPADVIERDAVLAAARRG